LDSKPFSNGECEVFVAEKKQKKILDILLPVEGAQRRGQAVDKKI